MLNQITKYVSIIFCLQIIFANSLDAQTTYSEAIQSITSQLNNANEIDINAHVNVLKNGKSIRSFNASIKKNGDKYYRSVDKIDTYILSNKYAIIDHEQKVVRYGEMESSENELKSNIATPDLNKLDSIIKVRNYGVKTISEDDKNIVFKVVMANELIKSFTLKINKSNWTVRSIIMVYDSSKDTYFDTVKVDYAEFKTSYKGEDFFNNSYFNFSKHKFHFKSTLKGYTKQNIDV